MNSSADSCVEKVHVRPRTSWGEGRSAPLPRAAALTGGAGAFYLGPLCEFFGSPGDAQVRIRRTRFRPLCYSLERRVEVELGLSTWHVSERGKH